MLNIEIGRTTRIGEEDVVVIAHAWGLYGAEHEDGHCRYEMPYSYSFNLEELISSTSVECGIEFFKIYGEACYVSSIRIMNEYDYEEFQKESVKALVEVEA